MYLSNSLFLCNSKKECFYPLGIDKITAKSQVSVDGTMITVPTSDSPADTGAVGGASDTESNSERDHEVHHTSHHSVLLFVLLQVKLKSCAFML